MTNTGDRKIFIREKPILPLAFQVFENQKYDANNKRTYRYDGSNTVKYFGDNSLVWGEIWQGDAADWYFMDGYAPLIKHNDSGTFYYINDHLGTPILVTDESGNVVWKGDYDPFGKCTPTVAMIDNYAPISCQGVFVL